MFHLGTTELIIIMVIVILLFGAGRIGKIAAEMGKGIRDFQKGLKSDEAPVEAGQKNESR
jgi:sec-independent protein translocase protein TatA